MDIDFDFAGEEDFGLARSFSSAPVGMITPQIDNKNHQNHYTEQQLGENVRDEGIRLDEFNFKMAPGVDVSDLTKKCSPLPFTASQVPKRSKADGTQDD